MITLTKTTKRLFPADPFNVDPATGIPVTSEVVAESKIVFEDDAMAAEYAEVILGMPESRVKVVMYRRCEFSPGDGSSTFDPETKQIVVYRFSA